MPQEQDPLRRSRLKVEDLPPDLLITGGPIRSIRREGGNPAAHEHAPTFCSMSDVNGNPVEVMKITTVSLRNAKTTRVEPVVRKEVLRAEGLWGEELPEHHILTHALRLFQTYGDLEKGQSGMKPRKIIPNDTSPRTILSRSGLADIHVNGVIRTLKEFNLICDYQRSGRSKLWVIDNEVRALGSDGSKYTSSDLLPGLRMRDATGAREQIQGETVVSPEEALLLTQPDENPFYIGKREKLVPQDDREEVLTKVLQATVFLAGDVQPNQDGWIRFTSINALAERIAELTEVSPTQSVSMLGDLRLMGLIKDPILSGHRGKRAIYDWEVNIGHGPVTSEDVKIARRGRYKIKMAREAARTGVAQTAEVVPQPTTPETEVVLESPQKIGQPTEPESGLPEAPVQDLAENDLNETLVRISEVVVKLEKDNSRLQRENTAVKEQLASAKEELRQQRIIADDQVATIRLHQETIRELRETIAGLNAQLEEQSREHSKPTVEIPPALLKYLNEGDNL